MKSKNLVYLLPALPLAAVLTAFIIHKSTPNNNVFYTQPQDNVAPHNQRVNNTPIHNRNVDNADYNVEISLSRFVFKEDSLQQTIIAVNFYDGNGSKLKINSFYLTKNLTMDGQVFGYLPGDAVSSHDMVGGSTYTNSLVTHFLYTQQNIDKFIEMFNSEQCRTWFSQEIRTQANIRITVEQ